MRSWLSSTGDAAPAAAYLRSMLVVFAWSAVATVVLSTMAYWFGVMLGERGELAREQIRARLGYARPPAPEARPIEAITDLAYTRI